MADCDPFLFVLDTECRRRSQFRRTGEMGREGSGEFSENHEEFEGALVLPIEHA